jgi:hypothetical protein
MIPLLSNCRIRRSIARLYSLSQLQYTIHAPTLNVDSGSTFDTFERD